MEESSRVDVGSNPTPGCPTHIYRGVAHLVERVVWDHEVARSIRVTPTSPFMDNCKICCKHRWVNDLLSEIIYGRIYESMPDAPICHFSSVGQSTALVMRGSSVRI